MYIEPETIITWDGSATLLHPFSGECYHSVHGAVTESLHTFINAGLAECRKQSVSILEMGFGSGLNALLSLLYGARHGMRIVYHAVELYPVKPSCASLLGYDKAIGCDPSLFAALHEAPWGERVRVTDRFTLCKSHCAIEEYPFDDIYDIAYWDAFAPDGAEGQWSAGIFTRLHESMPEGGLLVTYCSKGTVKRALREAGFTVERLPGAPGKRHMVRASRIPAPTPDTTGPDI